MKRDTFYALICFFVFLVLYGAYSAYSVFYPNGFGAKDVYAIEYNVPADHVFHQDRPKDCDFDWAPLGNKGCHYQKTVLVSYDGGRTWKQTATTTSVGATDVSVTWGKVSE